ncbi:MAG: hypothetical protein KF817_02315 [Phycisphaeraceae bacterium]|nr:hypothetical protein [Phycisphaeraceae bacterium]
MAQPTAASTEAKPNVSFDEFLRLDLRVATIVAAEPHPSADRLLRIELDDGSPTRRQVCAGIRAWYDPARLVGRQVVIVANLEPRVIRGERSEGMILAASDVLAVDENGQPTERTVVILTPDSPVKPGSTVS